MSTRTPERMLQRLAAANGVLMPEREGRGYCYYPNGDRRRRPLVRLSASQVGALQSEGVLTTTPPIMLSDAGRARIRREAADDADEPYLAQHAPITTRSVIDEQGAVHAVRGIDWDASLRRLAALRDNSGAPWLSADELAAAAQLRSDWERAEIGLVRGSDWGAPPRGGVPRGQTQDIAMAARCDARRRLEERLRALAAPLRRAVQRVCLNDEGLESLERAEGWPVRSGKLALKLALAQLAQSYAS